ncbi:Sec1-like protein [Sphaerosporella brunnea]|uniref:Sec1-like protein n=1 Tax=Sphaerosporella brunnea TaxID=1250544 RepID=A0A5J5ELB4_9PEZI|nr:Sec1-like protein [Sphaerosporella brunnea]
MVSLLEVQKTAVIEAIRSTQPQNTWRCVVMDETSNKLITNVMEEHHILGEKVSEVRKIEEKRMPQPMECIYILTPDEFSVQCFISDFARPKPRYSVAHLLWTSELDNRFRQMILDSPARQFIRGERVLSIGFYPRESHLFTLREPSSFFNLYHPQCRDTVSRHLRDMARKIASACVSLGEYPTIRYYRPPSYMLHEARVLSEMLAKNVQDELDTFAKSHPDFPPPVNNRPKGVLFIVDRSMDLYAPLLHEFTYQAMAQDLLPIQEGDKITYKVDITTSTGDTEKKEMTITDEDSVWVANRHQHMKDTIERLMADFQKFLGDNKNFVDSQSSTSLYAIRDMMASLPQYQGQKDMYSLHLTMAQECMAQFEKKKLPDVALLEQSLSTGLDETGRPPRNAAETLVRLLDDPALGPPERLRLILIYLLYRDGLLNTDIQRLIHHSALRRPDENVVRSLDLLGARVTKELKDATPNRNKFRKPRPPPAEDDEGNDFSRYTTVLKHMLEDHIKGQLDPQMFPYIKPELAPVGSTGGGADSTTSLRSAKPTWAKSRLSVVEPRQRIMVFMAGGATFSEARACYEVSKQSVRDVFLGTSHMLNPNLFLTQLQGLAEHRSVLQLPADAPKKAVPQHLLEPDPVPKPTPPPVQQTRTPPAAAPAAVKPPTTEMSGLKVHHKPNRPYYEVDKKKKKKFGVF